MTTDSAPKILVADDDLEILALVARHLSSLPAEIVEASDGEEALRLARRARQAEGGTSVRPPRPGTTTCQRRRRPACKHELSALWHSNTHEAMPMRC